MTAAETFTFVGHDAAERELAGAIDSGRFHHAWLINGPRGVGKATLAFRAARAALGARRIGPRPLDAAPDDIVARQIAAQAHPDFFLLQRGLNERGKLRREITAEDARSVGAFFTMGSASGGLRVAIIDSVDDLNRHAANAILKTLEEPPPRTLLLLVCHAPGAILPTIRSRCRRLTLRPLHDAEMAQLGDFDAPTRTLAAGRPGRALTLEAEPGFASAVVDALGRLEKNGGAALLALAGGGDRAERLSFVLDALEDWLHAAAVRGDPRANAYAALYSELEALRAQADGLDLDPGHALARAALLFDRAAAAPT
ncbi:MAG: DNA polymerase III subunit delta' [Alphaproteobacteria bacterium]|nr:DNA polymerase III subunit delta' [Alphaproteobacteria bacterium]